MNKPITSWTRTLAALRLKVNWDAVLANKARKQAIPKKIDSSMQVQVLEERQMLSADIGSLTLLSDSGESATDSFTTNGVVSGQATGIASGSLVSIEVDANGDQITDYSVSPIGDYSSGTANFEFDVNQYNDLWDPGQKDLSFRVASTDFYNDTTYSGWSNFGFHLSEFDIATLDESSAPDSYQLGDNKFGVAVDDTATGVGFIMYSEESVHTRFTVHADNSDHLVGVRYNDTTNGWEYSTNVDGEWIGFEITVNDRLIASVDFDNDTIETLEGALGEVNGMASGYSQGDLTFAADVWNSGSNDGEFSISGTQFDVDVLTELESVRTEIGDTNFGIAIDDDATGHGYIMYSEQSIHDRFSANPPLADQSDHLIAIRYNDELEYWEYNADGTDWYEFAIAEGDRLLAAIDYTYDTIESLEGSIGEAFGIQHGFTKGDLAFVINQWNGASDDGEVTVSGSYFSISDSTLQQPNTYQLGAVDKGIAVGDAETGIGYAMFSSENVHDRFVANPPLANNSENIIAVRYNATSEKWEYNTDSSLWYEFEIVGTDRLLAKLDFTNDTIESLQGATGDRDGIQQGFARGDLNFEADVWDGASDVGEFTISGTEFTVNPLEDGNIPTLHFPDATYGMQQSEDYYLDELGKGIAVGDTETGPGYILFSSESVHTRFATNSPYADNSDHLIAVRYNQTTSTWEYNDNTVSWFAFTASEDDRLVAAVDFDNDSITSLKAATGDVEGINQGFTSGDLTFTADWLDGVSDDGEFTVGGTHFTVAPAEWPTRTITFKNTGTYSAELQDVSVPFGFEVIDFSTTTLAPGDSTDIVVAMTGLVRGEMSGQMAIEVSSQGAKRIHTVNLEGYVYEAEVDVTVDGVAFDQQIDFGVLATGQTVQKQIVITNTGRAAITLSDDVAIPDGFVLFAGLSQTVLAVGESATLTLQYTATEQGQFSGMVRVNLAERMIPVFSGSVLAEVDVARLSVSVDGSNYDHTGGTVDFGAVMVGTNVERTLTIKNDGVTSLDVTDITVPTGVQIIGYTGPFSVAAGATVSYVVRLDSVVNISVADEIVIHSNDPNESEFSVATSGAVVNVQTPTLLNDVGIGAEATDNISNDPRVKVMLADVPLHISEGDVIAHVDIDGDGTTDQSFTVTSNRFVYDPQLEEEGSFTRSFKIEVINSVTGVSEFSNWMSFTAEYDSTVTNEDPTLGSLQLAGDGLVGNQMMSTVITGTATNDGSLVDLVVLVDHDGDGLTDGSAAVLADGTFEYNGYGLELGNHTLSFTVAELTYSGEILTSTTQSIAFELIAYPAPSFTTVELKYPSASSSIVTSIPTVQGVISEGDAAGRYFVVWGTEEDGEYLNSAEVDELGNFVFDAVGLDVGLHTIYLKSVDTETGAISSATSFAFTLESKEAPTLTSYGLENGVIGAGITDDPTVIGTITSEWGVEDREIQFDYDGDGEPDGSAYADENGDFVFLPESLSFGDIQMSIRTVIFDTVTGEDVYGSWASLDFTFVRTIDTLVTSLALKNDTGSGHTTDSIVEGVVELSPGTPAAFSEVEFDYNDDGTADGSTLADGLGEFTHFADVPVGETITFKARARQIDDYNGEYVYGDWASITFTRDAGGPSEGGENANNLASSSAQNTANLADAIGELLVDIKDQFNDATSGGGGGPGGPGGPMGAGEGGGATDGLDLGHLALAFGTNNEAFGVTGVDDHSIESGQDSSGDYLVTTTGSPAKASASGILTAVLNVGDFTVNGTFNYTLTNMGSTSSLVYDLAFTLTASDGDVVTGSVGGNFSNASGTFDFTETFTLLGTVDDSTSDNATDYQSTLTTQNGTYTSGQTSYDFTRTELVDNTAGLDVDANDSTGDSDGGQLGTYTETGSGVYSVAGASSQSKSVTRNYTSTYDYAGNQSRTVTADGVSGAVNGPESDDVDMTKIETGNYDLVDGAWEFTDGTFSDSIISSSTTTETAGGTYTSAGSGTGAISTGSSEENTGSETGVVATYTYTGTRILSESSNYSVSGTIAADGSVTASYTLTANASYDVNLSLTGSLSGSNNGISTTGSGSASYIELSTTAYNQSGTYTETATTFSINASGDNTYNSESTLSKSGTKTVSSPTFSKTTNILQYDVHHIGATTNDFNYTSDVTGETTTGNYTINDTTTLVGRTSGNASYTNHDTQATIGSSNAPAKVTGTSSANSEFDTSLTLVEGGSYTIDGNGSTVIGTFDKLSSENRSGGSSGNLTYSRNAGSGDYSASSQQTVETTLSKNSTSTSTDVGSFTLYFDSSILMTATADYKDGYGQGPSGEASVISGDYTNNGTTSGSTVIDISFSESSSFGEGASSSSSGHVDTDTSYSATAAESGDYTITDGVRAGTGTYNDTKNSTSITDSASNGTSIQGEGTSLVNVDRIAGGDVTSYTTNNVTTTTIFTEDGSHTDGAGVTTTIGNYHSTTNTVGSGTAGTTTTGDGVGSKVDTVTGFTRNSTDDGTSTTIAPTDNYSNSGGAGDSGFGFSVMTADKIGGTTSRVGTFSTDYSSTTDSTSSSYADANRNGHTYHFNEWTISNSADTVDETNGQYSYAVDGSGSRTADFKNTAKSKSFTISFEDASYKTPGGESPYIDVVVFGISVPLLNKAEGSSRGSESHEFTIATTKIDRTEDGASSDVTDAQSVSTSTSTGKLKQFSDATSFTHLESSSWSRFATKDLLRFESGSSVMDSFSKSHQTDETPESVPPQDNSFVRNDNGITETVKRNLKKKSVSSGKGKSNTHTSSANGDYSHSKSDFTTKSNTKYEENGTVTEFEDSKGVRTNVQADGTFDEKSNSSQTTHNDFKEFRSGESPNMVASKNVDGSGSVGGTSGPGETHSTDKSSSTSTSFTEGTFANTGTEHHRTADYHSKDVSKQKGESKSKNYSINKDGSRWDNEGGKKSKSLTISNITGGNSVDSSTAVLSKDEHKFIVFTATSGSGSGKGELSSSKGNKSGNSYSTFSSGSFSVEFGSVNDDGAVAHRSATFFGGNSEFQYSRTNTQTTSIDYWSLGWDIAIGIYTGVPTVTTHEWGNSLNRSVGGYIGSSDTWGISTLGDDFTVNVANADPEFVPHYKKASFNFNFDTSTEQSGSYTYGESEYDTVTTSGDLTTTVTTYSGMEKGTKNYFHSTDNRWTIYAAAGNGTGDSPTNSDYSFYSFVGVINSNDKSDDYKEQWWGTETTGVYSDSGTSCVGENGSIGPGGSVSAAVECELNHGQSHNTQEADRHWDYQSDIDKIDFDNTSTAGLPDPDDVKESSTETVSFGKDTEHRDWGNRSGTGDTIVVWDYYNEHERTDDKVTTIVNDVTQPIVYTKTHTWLSTYSWTKANGESDSGGDSGSDTNVNIIKTMFADEIEWWNKHKDKILDWVQLGLDALGMIPGIGWAFDLANAGISLARGNYLEAAMNLAAAIPGAGNAVTAAKWAKKAVTVASKAAKYVGKSTKAVKGATKMGSKALGMVGNGAKRAASYAGKAVDGIKGVGRKIKCKWTGKGCFVGDTEVFVYQQAPTAIASSWMPIEMPSESGLSESRSFAGAWIALSATGVVIVLAKELRRRNQGTKKSGLSFAGAAESPMNAWERLTFVVNDELRELRSQCQKFVNKTLAPTNQPQLAFSTVMGGNLVNDSNSDSNPVSSVIGMRFRKDDESTNGQSPVRPSCDVRESTSPRVKDPMCSDPRFEPRPDTVDPESEDPVGKAPIVKSWVNSMSPALKLMLLSLVASLTFGSVMYFGGSRETVPKMRANDSIFSAVSLSSDAVQSASSLDLTRLNQAGVESPERIATIPIRDIRIGMRVPAFNPEVTDRQRATWDEGFDPASHRKFTLVMNDESGVTVTLLRSDQWLVDSSSATNDGISAVMVDLYRDQLSERTVFQTGIDRARALWELNPLAELKRVVFLGSRVS